MARMGMGPDSCRNPDLLIRPSAIFRTRPPSISPSQGEKGCRVSRVVTRGQWVGVQQAKCGPKCFRYFGAARNIPPKLPRPLLIVSLSASVRASGPTSGRAFAALGTEPPLSTSRVMPALRYKGPTAFCAYKKQVLRLHGGAHQLHGQNPEETGCRRSG